MFDNSFNIEPGVGIALDVTYLDMPVWRDDLGKFTLLRLNPFL